MFNPITPAYQHLLKPILFKFDPEFVHDQFTFFGHQLGNYRFTRSLIHRTFAFNHPALTQTLDKLVFANPVGLSAGFDYDAKLTNIIPSVGFAFESTGTVTRQAYEGNDKPRLVRLSKSQSILVNKGFKSAGIQSVLDHYLSKPDPSFRLGISIGATNSAQTAEPKTQIPDIISSFEYLVSHPKYSLIDYIELNISCPNVLGAGSLASPTYLKQILSQINQLKLTKPVWIKFPIHVEDDEALKLVEIMIKHGVSSVVIGNLFKKRDAHYVNPADLAQVAHLKGNFSGKPTQSLSNHLIGHVYQHFGQDIHIVGVGGIFNAQDAYQKIKLGASLVQLITGMIYQGPGLIGQINRDLVSLLKQDGFTHISQAIGSSSHKQY